MRTGELALVTLLLGASIGGAAADPLVDRFHTPPRECRPETWFHLIGGNIGRSFLTSDLQAVSDAGFLGIHLFHGRGGKWPGVQPQIQTLSPAWDGMVAHMADETRRLGLRFTMQNCPGWAMSGGPWITPDMAMRHLISGRSEVTGGKPVAIDLAPPQPSKEKWRDYRDITVLAFPTPEGDIGGYLATTAIRSNQPDLPWREVLAGEKNATVSLPTAEEPTWVGFEFAGPDALRSIELPPIELLMARRCFIPESSIRIQALQDSRWRDLISHEVPYGNWQDRQPEHPFVVSVPDARARRYRVIFENSHPMTLSYLRLSTAARVHDWRGQAGLGLRKGQAAQPWVEPAAPRFELLDHGSRLLAFENGTWHNRLAYDASLPARQRNTWTLNGPPPDRPPKPAGLLGPALLRIADRINIPPPSP